jgi:pimeloyl-ACP methyl ester carboxylesterase
MENTASLNYITHTSSIHNEWLLLIHGAGGSTRTWRRQVEGLGKHYNLLIVDLPGHGENYHKPSLFPEYSFPFVAKKVWEVVDHIGVGKLHVAGVSLGTIICLQMRQLQPERFLSIIMPGAIVKLNRKLKLLARISLGSAKVIGFRNFYKMTARLMLPRRNHKKSRDIFVKESKTIKIAEFKKWTALYFDLNKTLKKFFQAPSSIPHLLVMGSQDHLFLKPAMEYAESNKYAAIEVIKGCGHVVSIERSKEFNDICLNFLKSAKTETKKHESLPLKEAEMEWSFS